MEISENYLEMIEDAVQECAYLPNDPGWYPSMEDAEGFTEGLQKKGMTDEDVSFLLWLVKFKNLTEEQKNVRKFLYKFLYDNTKLM